MSTGSEVEDRDLWPKDRIVRGIDELTGELKRREAEEAASKAAELTPEQKESASMKQFGQADAVEARRKILKEFGFDPGWR